jgi:hypothetical protein
VRDSISISTHLIIKVANAHQKILQYRRSPRLRLSPPCRCLFPFHYQRANAHPNILQYLRLPLLRLSPQYRCLFPSGNPHHLGSTDLYRIVLGHLDSPQPQLSGPRIHGRSLILVLEGQQLLRILQVGKSYPNWAILSNTPKTMLPRAHIDDL